MSNVSFFKTNKTARAVVCLLLFVPLVIAIISGVFTDPNSVTANSLEHITVTASKTGHVFEFSDSHTLELYSSVSHNARKIDGTFRDFSLETPYSVTFRENTGDPITYEFYMTTNKDDCVYVSPAGEYFMMAAEIAEKLIVREEFSSLNDLMPLPAISVSGFIDGVSLEPDSYEWTYTALDGTLATVKNTSKAKNPVIKFDNSDEGFLSVGFDKTPDSLKLTLKNGASIVFDDKYENFSTVKNTSYTSDTPLSLTVVAEWYEIEGAEFYGSATYTADLLYDVAPSYRIVDANGVYAGDFTVLRMSDFNDGEKLTIINDLGIPEQTNVYDIDEEGIKIAFIPFSPDAAVGEHTLTLKTESGHTSEVTAKVKSAKELTSQTLIIEEDSLSKAFTEAGLKEFNDLVLKLTSESVNQHLYEGKFVYPTGSNKTAPGSATFGTHRKVLSLYTGEYTQNGLDLAAQNGQDIKASNSGKVVFAGENTFFGNLVVVDHGCGILSYYGNLESIDVKVGDSVVKNDTVLGKAGSTGFACVVDGASTKSTTLTHFAFSFGGVFIDPQSPCKYGVNF